MRWQRGFNLLGCTMGEEGVHIVSLQFVNDMLFRESNVRNAFTWKTILRCFEMLLRLKVIFHKSKLVGVGVSKEHVQRFACIVKCQLMEIFFVYLGISVWVNFKGKLTWKPVLDKIIKKHASWKHHFLSFGGRICLLKSVLSSLPLFFFHFIKRQKRSLRILQSFKWGAYGGQRKIRKNYIG